MHCDARIAQEMKRAEEVLPKSSWAVVRSRTEYALLEGRGGWLAQDGLSSIHPFPSHFVLPPPPFVSVSMDRLILIGRVQE